MKFRQPSGDVHILATLLRERFEDSNDLAVLEVPNVPPGIGPMRIAWYYDIDRGKPVYLFGFQHGEQFIFSEGRIINTEVEVAAGGGGRMRVIGDAIVTKETSSGVLLVVAVVVEDARVVCSLFARIVWV